MAGKVPKFRRASRPTGTRHGATEPARPWGAFERAAEGAYQEVRSYLTTVIRLLLSGAAARRDPDRSGPHTFFLVSFAILFAVNVVQKRLRDPSYDSQRTVGDVVNLLRVEDPKLLAWAFTVLFGSFVGIQLAGRKLVWRRWWNLAVFVPCAGFVTYVAMGQVAPVEPRMAVCVGVSLLIWVNTVGLTPHARSAGHVEALYAFGLIHLGVVLGSCIEAAWPSFPELLGYLLSVATWTLAARTMSAPGYGLLVLFMGPLATLSFAEPLAKIAKQSRSPMTEVGLLGRDNDQLWYTERYTDRRQAVRWACHKAVAQSVTLTEKVDATPTAASGGQPAVSGSAANERRPEVVADELVCMAGWFPPRREPEEIVACQIVSCTNHQDCEKTCSKIDPAKACGVCP